MHANHLHGVHNGKNNRRASRKLGNLLLKNLIVFDERKGVFVMYSKNKISFRWIRSDNICSTCHVHLQTKFHLNILCCRNKVQYNFCLPSQKRWFIFLGSIEYVTKLYDTLFKSQKIIRIKYLSIVYKMLLSQDLFFVIFFGLEEDYTYFTKVVISSR